jgi:hypothetical protein
VRANLAGDTPDVGSTLVEKSRYDLYLRLTGQNTNEQTDISRQNTNEQTHITGQTNKHTYRRIQTKYK